MAGHASRILHAGELLVLNGKIRPVMFFGPECNKIRVACFAVVGDGQIVVAGIAGCHGGEALRSCEGHSIESLMASFAGHRLAANVDFMVEDQLAFGVLKGDVCCLVRAGVAISAIILQLLFVTRLAIRLLTEEIVV